MSNHKTDIQLLKDNFKALKLSLEWLEHSMEQCADIKSFESISIHDYDLLESLTARYARTVDILFNKVFRSLSRIETNNITPSLLDILFYFEKIGIVQSVENTRYLKELRNDIVHEYFIENINELYENVSNHTKYLYELANRTIKHCEVLISKFE